MATFPGLGDLWSCMEQFSVSASGLPTVHSNMVFSKRALRTSKNNQDEHVSTCLHVWLMSMPKSLKRKVTQPSKPIHHVPSTPWLFTCQHLHRLHPSYSTLPGTQLQWPHFAARQHSHGLPQICPHPTSSTNSLRHLCRIQRFAASGWERHWNMAKEKSQPLHHCIHMGRIIEDIWRYLHTIIIYI